MHRTLKMTAFASLAALALSVTGCNDAAPGKGPGTGGPGTVPPGTTPTPASSALYAGVYDSVAPVDFTQQNVLPGQIGPILGALSELHDKPGDALVSFATIAGVKLDKTVKAIAGGVLNGLITSALQNQGTINKITDVVSGVTELTKTMDFHQTITIHTPASNGATMVEQQFVSVDFKTIDFNDLTNNKPVVISVDIPTDAKVGAHATMSATVTPHANAPAVADADLSMGSSTFTLPLGEMLLTAAGPTVFQAIAGANDLKGALNNLVDCNAVGQAVADYVNGALGSNLGPTIFSGVCTAGLGVIADQITQQIKMVVLKDVRVDSGRAQLLDVSPTKPSVDKQSDQISGGTWSWVIPIGDGITVPSTFAGNRIGNAN